MHEFDLKTIVLRGWPVLTVLFAMSILSITVIVDRYRTLRRARLDARTFMVVVNRILQEDSPTAAYRHCRKRDQPVAQVAAAIIAQPGNRENRERALQHAMQAQIRDLEEYVPILGTIASSAPFVGLFGTVIGIIRAFAGIAHNAGGGPEVVAAGISEALITTAGGLLVAIPALVGYNYFIRRIQRLTEEIDLAAYDLIETLANPTGQPQNGEAP